MEKILRHPLSIRFVHWTTMISIVLLSFSGFYITSPMSKFIFSKMDTARYVHFIFMFILTAVFIFRLYLFVGEKKGRDVLPSLKDFKEFPALMKYMLFISKEHPHNEKYNIGQKALYTLWFVLIAVQIVTGFILYLPAQTMGIATSIGGFMVVRFIHNAVLWFFACTVLVHIYLDLTEGKEVALSMFTGYTTAPAFHDVLPMPDLGQIGELELKGNKKSVSEEA